MSWDVILKLLPMLSGVLPANVRDDVEKAVAGIRIGSRVIDQLSDFYSRRGRLPTDEEWAEVHNEYSALLGEANAVQAELRRREASTSG